MRIGGNGMLALAVAAALALGGFAATAQDGAAITWGETITLTPPDGGMGRYPRLVKIEHGAHAGDLLLCYQSDAMGGDFFLYRSRDLGRSWDGPEMVNNANRTWNYASCNVIQLTDGRLLMSMQRRLKGSNLGQDYYMDVRFSEDGGETWGAPIEAFQGANWEGRPFEVPHDGNGDGINDIYLFYTQRVIDTQTEASRASREGDFGRAVAWVASYDGGATWTDPNPERFTGRIVHRNFDESRREAATDQSGGGMPTPFLLPNDRVGFVAEEIGKAASPYLVANDPGDWDWTGPAFQGPWTSADYDGSNDDAVYPLDPDNIWRVNTLEFGGAPYGTVLPDGRIAVSVNSAKVIKVWVGDENGKGFRLQDNPFGNKRAFYSFIEPISDSEILVGAGPVEAGESFIYLRVGHIR
jgi:hypothetical protein